MNERTIQARTPLAASTSRRGALRLLTGFALAGSSMAALTGDANARSTNKEKGKKRGKPTCDARKPLARVKVAADGAIVRTPTLENGRPYRLRVSGVVTGTAPLFPTVGVDAGYLFREDGDTITKDSAEGLDFGLWIDDEAAAWGGYPPAMSTSGASPARAPNSPSASSPSPSQASAIRRKGN